MLCKFVLWKTVLAEGCLYYGFLAFSDPIYYSGTCVVRFYIVWFCIVCTFYWILRAHYARTYCIIIGLPHVQMFNLSGWVHLKFTHQFCKKKIPSSVWVRVSKNIFGMYLRPGQFKTQPSPSYHNLDSYYDNIIHGNMHFGVTAMLLCWMIISLTLFGLSQRKYNSYYSIEVWTVCTYFWICNCI